MGRTSPWLLGAATYSCLLDGSAVNDQHCGVDVEHQGTALAWPIEKTSSQDFVHMSELPDVLWRKTLQKSAYRGLIRVLVQTNNLLERSVGLQYLGFVDAIHSRDDCVEDGEDHPGRMIFSKSRSKTQLSLKELP
jgi:hypothetical protein